MTDERVSHKNDNFHNLLLECSANACTKLLLVSHHIFKEIKGGCLNYPLVVHTTSQQGTLSKLKLKPKMRRLVDQSRHALLASAYVLVILELHTK